MSDHEVLRDLAFSLIDVALGYDGEQIVSPGDLPDSMDDLLALSQLLGRIAGNSGAAARVRREVDEAAAGELGPGLNYRYGDHVVSWKHGSQWRARPEAKSFIVAVASAYPELILELFNENQMRVGGIGKVAIRLGRDPEDLVREVMARKYDDEPRLQWKWQPEKGEEDDRADSGGAPPERA